MDVLHVAPELYHVTLVKQDITNNHLYLVEYVPIYQVVLHVTVQLFHVLRVLLDITNNPLLNVKLAIT